MLRNNHHILAFFVACLLSVEQGIGFLYPKPRSVYIQKVSNHYHRPVFDDRQSKAVLSSDPITAVKAQNQGDRNDADPTGMKRGLVLFPLMILVSIWMFSIPPEYRRAKICTEQQVIDNPGSKCITAGNWISGIQDYYRNGGGVEFDFTIDPDS